MADAIGAAVALFAACMALRPIVDNSFFTHVATGRIIVDTRAIPSVDPYTFTAHGEPWVVQSWFVSALYGLVDSWAGGVGLRLLSGLLVGVMVALVWWLTAPARTLASRIVITGLVLVVGLTFWVPRPQLFGFLFLVLTMVLIERRWNPRWMIPIMWFWANSHGSFPLGLVAIGAFALGRRLDKQDATTETRALLWAVVGTVAAAVNPVGPKLLIFPINLLGRTEVLQRVFEWQSPNFGETYARVFLLQTIVAIVLLVRRPSYRSLVPLVVFVAAALLGVRNIPIASLVLLPGLVAGIGPIGSLDGREKGPAPLVLLAVVAVLALLGGSTLLARPTYELGTYPVAGVAWLESQQLIGTDVRIVTTDQDGNFLELLYGPRHQGFFDDRFDMYPMPFLREYLALNAGQTGWNDVLQRHEIDVVMWPRSASLAALIEESPAWRVRYQDDAVIIACHRGSARLTC